MHPEQFLSIDGGAGHARAIAIELWPKPPTIVELSAHRSVIEYRVLRKTSLSESYVERLDVAIVAKAVGDALHITRIAE